VVKGTNYICICKSNHDTIQILDVALKLLSITDNSDNRESKQIYNNTNNNKSNHLFSRFFLREKSKTDKNKYDSF
jgi:hypothetical protein